MAREVLIVFHCSELPNGNLVIGLNTVSNQLRDQWRNTDTNKLKAQFEGKKVQVFGEGYQFETAILGVEVLNSIADFKNVFLRLDNHAYTQKIQLNDEVEVDL